MRKKSFPLGAAVLASLTTVAILNGCATQTEDVADSSTYSQRSPAAEGNCVPARERIEVRHHGQYHRIHPSGDMFLYTDSDRSVLVDIRDRKNPKIIRTPMREETYPVEGAKGGWDLLASPVGGGARGTHGGTDYFATKDLLNGAPMNARPAYTDAQFGQYYHSSAELPGSSDKVKKVRTLLFENRLYRDYEMSIGANGRVGQVKKSTDKKLCENLFKKPVRSAAEQQAYRTAMRELETMETKYHRDFHSQAAYDKKKAMSDDERKAFEAEAKAASDAIREKRTKAESALYGSEYAENRRQLRALQTQNEAADREYRESAPYKAAQQMLRDAEEAFRKVSVEIASNPEVVALKAEVEALRQAHRAATTAAARTEVENRYHRSHENYFRLQERLRRESQANKDATALRQQGDAAVRETQKLDIYVKLSAIRQQMNGVETAAWALREGRNLGNPVLSKDGTHVAGIVGNRIEVMKIDAKGDCEEVAKIPYQGSKVSFSYPKEGQPLRIAFTAEGGAANRYRNSAYVFDVEKKQATVISGEGETDISYPGFTLDGRVMYRAGQGMTIVDPLQVMKQGCIAANGEQPRTQGTNPGSVTR